MRRLALVAALTLGIAGGAQAAAVGKQGGEPAKAGSGEPTFELVGQVTNSAAGVTPATSIQYGYLPFVRGIDAVFAAGSVQDESTALYTLYTFTTTTRVIANGTLRVISREGTTTIYSDPDAGSSFANPDSFKDGTPIEVSTLHQQVVVDTLTGAFTAMNLNIVTSSTQTVVNGKKVRLAKVGDRFRTTLTGHLNSPAPPSGYMAGYAVAVGAPS